MQSTHLVNLKLVDKTETDKKQEISKSMRRSAVPYPLYVIEREKEKKKKKRERRGEREKKEKERERARVCAACRNKK